MKWFEDLYNQCLITFPNMPKPIIENAILRTVSQFFRETELLKDDVYIDADCGTTDFVLDIPDGRTVVQAKQMYHHANPDKAPLVSELWCVIPPAEARFAPGYWVDLSAYEPTVSVSTCWQQKKGQYCLTYSWTPKGTDCDIPHHFIGKYFDALVNGALGKLYLVPMDNDSQSASFAKYYISEYERAIRNARVEETQNHTNRPLYMQGGSFL